MRASSAGFYTTGGTLRPDAPSYVERHPDRELFEGLLEGEQEGEGARERAQPQATGLPVAVSPSLSLSPSARLVVFLDEIDVVRSLPFRADELFAAVRACYNRRTEDPAFERLSFCLLGV